MGGGFKQSFLAGCLNTEGGGKHFSQLRLPDRLGDVMINPQFTALDNFTGLPRRGKHDDGRFDLSGKLFDPSGQIEAIHFRHVGVHDNKLEWLCSGYGRLDFHQSRLAVFNDSRNHAPVGQELTKLDLFVKTLRQPGARWG